VDWLSFDADQAPSSLAPNGTYAVDGILFAYGDSCATINWDPATRCASGTLCDPGVDAANWGMSIGFNFKYTGANGSPPNTTELWDPDAVGALGIAWEISGEAPSLEAWVLNMDPIWNGNCASLSCDIVGPPDGLRSPALKDQMLFSSLQKDNWGGSGVSYRFDPAQVHALQFKLPAIYAGAVPFAFCVTRLGIVH
jgi:hypothetical protein